MSVLVFLFLPSPQPSPCCPHFCKFAPLEVTESPGLVDTSVSGPRKRQSWQAARSSWVAPVSPL